MSCRAIRTTTLAAVVVVLAAAAALAATRTYRGEIDGDPKATVRLNVDRDDDAVVGFKVKQLFLACDGGVEARLGTALIDGEATIGDRGRFKLKGEDPKLKLAVRGRLLGKRRAEGTVVYSGPTTVGGQRRDCTSGKVGWTAKR